MGYTVKKTAEIIEISYEKFRQILKNDPELEAMFRANGIAAKRGQGKHVKRVLPAVS